MTEGSGEPYTVSISQNELDKLKRWGAWAEDAGVLEDYLQTLKTVNYRLAFEPMDWGEPRYTLHQLKLEIRLGTSKMLNVWYGVHFDERIVFVKKFQFRRDYPQGGPPEIF